MLLLLMMMMMTMISGCNGHRAARISWAPHAQVLNGGNEAKSHVTAYQRHWCTACLSVSLSVRVSVCLSLSLSLSLCLCSDGWGVQSTRDTSLINDWSTPAGSGLHSASRQNGRSTPPLIHAELRGSRTPIRCFSDDHNAVCFYCIFLQFLPLYCICYIFPFVYF